MPNGNNVTLASALATVPDDWGPSHLSPRFFRYLSERAWIEARVTHQVEVRLTESGVWALSAWHENAAPK